MYKLCKIEKSANRQREVENMLMYMMEKQEFSKIKVSELCEKAKIPRKSFYVYFESKEDVLHALLEHTICDFDYYDMNTNHIHTHTYCELKRFFAFWKGRNVLLSGLLRSDLSGLLVMKMTEHTICDERNIPFIHWEDEKKKSEIALKYAISGLMSMVVEWHKGDYLQTVDEMAEIATTLLTSNYFKNI
ncbi:MAG: TetR/AcrR family transcriptional regulator [Agathobacter sp.]|nr:TetR/AcrR family transcriptional regulator [Agathobacter sp.]MBQ6843918.1 TetR/AcrR family transcriptional regulator [Agathobacter sp.]